MSDLLDVELRRLALALVDEAPPAPLFGELQGRQAPLLPTPTPRRRPRKVLVGAVAIVVALALVALAVVLFDGASSEHSRVRPAHPTPSTLDGVWRELPSEFDGSTFKTTYPFAVDDDTLLTITTSDRLQGDVSGEIYRFSDDTVRTIAPSGLEWRAGAAVVWTGTEAIVAGGSNGPGIEHAAAAYNPATDTWRALPDPPGFVPDVSNDHVAGPAVWTGREMVAWKSRLAYNPATYRWRTIAAPPLGDRRNEAVVATPHGVFVWGGCDPLGPHGMQCDDAEFTGDELVDGAIYDPAADNWTPVAESPLTGGDYITAVWTGSEVVVLVDDPPTTEGAFAAAYSPSTKQWRTLPNPPRLGQKYAVSVWNGEHILTHSPTGGVLTAFDPTTDKWSVLPPGPIRHRQSAVWAGNELVITGGYPSATPWAFQFRDLKATASAPSEDDVLARFARRDLRAARKSYGEIRIPEVPRGFRLTRVSQGGIGTDLWWHRETDDASIHLWQTHNGALLEAQSDPSNPDTGVPIEIAGTTWIRNTINACADTVCLSRRFPNGEVVSLNGTLSLDSLKRVAAKV